MQRVTKDQIECFETRSKPDRPGEAMLLMRDKSDRHEYYLLFTKEEWEAIDAAMRDSLGKYQN